MDKKELSKFNHTPAKPDSLTKEIKPISADELLNGSETGGRLNSEV